MMQKCRFLAVCFLVAATAGTAMPVAWSFDRSADQPVQVFKPVANDDACRPFLIGTGNPATVEKASLKNDERAGSAALGLMIGVRSAVGPKEGTATYIAYRAAGVDSERALAIARYRHCRNQQTLESLASN